jgi:hypothetical protein
MPFKYTTVATPKGQITTRADLDALIVKHTQGAVKFDGLLLDLPFGKRGATELRTTAKTYGARWNGSDWSIPSTKYPTLTTNGGLSWLLGAAVIAGIKTRVYTLWVWDGVPVDIALDLPFEDRHIAKQHGAKWDPGAMRWCLPAAAVTQSVVDALNAAEVIDGALDATGNVVRQAHFQAPAAQPAPTFPPVAGPTKTDLRDTINTTLHTLLTGVAHGVYSTTTATAVLIQDTYANGSVHTLRGISGDVSESCCHRALEAWCGRLDVQLR